MNELFSIAGRVAVTTGAGGVSGGNIAQYFVQQGAKVVAIDIRQERLDNCIAELKQYGQDVIDIIEDVLDIANLEKVTEEIIVQWRQTDILLNITGGNMLGATPKSDQDSYDMDVSCWEKVTGLDMSGTIYLSMVFDKVIAKQKRGCIVSVSSMVVYSVIAHMSGYSTAETTITNFTQWLASEMTLEYGDGIHVNATAPGFFIDDQNRHVLINPDGLLTDRGKRVLVRTPMSRFSGIKELNGAVQFLYSEAASFVTGVMLPIDSGLSVFSDV